MVSSPRQPTSNDSSASPRAGARRRTLLWAAGIVLATAALGTAGLGVFAYQKGLAVDSMTTSYFTSRASVVRGHLPGMNPLRRALFRCF